MAASHVELSEVLKGPLGPEAARMIAEAISPAEDLATKEDLSELRLDVVTEVAKLRTETAEFRTEVAERFRVLESDIMGRLWVMFVPLWIGVFGLIATLIVRGG